MNYVEAILPEFDREMANTRKVLELVPEHLFNWQAHIAHDWLERQPLGRDYFPCFSIADSAV